MLGHLLPSLFHPTELYALVQYKLNEGGKSETEITSDEALAYCYKKLTQTSRSFAVVIKKLPEELRLPVMIFYLVLRGLDTVEDDMKYPLDKKKEDLKKFHEYIHQEGWNLEGCGENENEVDMMKNFHHIIQVFKRLDKKYQDVITDITDKMGNGMCEFLERTVITLEDWDLYCHYVAGLVGIGLSGLFSRSGLESTWFQSADKLSNSMGLFLQKTNITRDFLEDIIQGRVFWPQQVWSKYAKELSELKEVENRTSAMYCLNDLITNALEHIPDCIEYMEHLHDPNVFNFCAIPQVMAIGTLAHCYNNPQVFKGVVKLRRGESAKIFNAVSDGIQSVYSYFYYFALVIKNKINPEDPNAKRTQDIVNKTLELCSKHISSTDRALMNPKLSTTLTIGVCLVGIVAVSSLVYTNSGSKAVEGLAN